MINNDSNYSGRSQINIRFVPLTNFLDKGSGICLDLGCGNAPHRSLIESAGYTWVGLDIRPYQKIKTQGSAHRLPFPDNSISLVVLWQVLEHLPEPWTALSEAYRVLQPGGRLIGSTSFLEPFHDFSYYGFSEIGLRYLLDSQKFVNVHISPGIISFLLIIWTLSSRMYKGKFSLPLFRGTGLLLNILDWLYGFFHHLYMNFAKQDSGSLENSYWRKRVPYEFAGHLVFSGIKCKNSEEN